MKKILLLFFLTSLFFVYRKDARAVCSSSYNCGVLYIEGCWCSSGRDYDNMCSDDGAPCGPNYSGACSCSAGCPPSGPNKSCSGANSTACYASADCGTKCVASYNCVWKGSGGVIPPPPPPGATPTPVPTATPCGLDSIDVTCSPNGNGLLGLVKNNTSGGGMHYTEQRYEYLNQDNRARPDVCFKDNWGMDWYGYIYLPTKGTWGLGFDQDNSSKDISVNLYLSDSGAGYKKPGEVSWQGNAFVGGSYTKMFDSYNSGDPVNCDPPDGGLEDCEYVKSRSRKSQEMKLEAGWYPIFIKYVMGHFYPTQKHPYRLWYKLVSGEGGGGGWADYKLVPADSGSAKPPCLPDKCSVQGFKVLMPGTQVAEPASSQTVSLGSNSSTSNPYVFESLDAGNKTVSVTTPAGYTAGYTACTNQADDTCNRRVATPGSSWSGDCPAGGRVDLWWYYFPPSFCKVSLSPSQINPGESATATFSGNGGGFVNEDVRLWMERLSPTQGGVISPSPGSFSFEWPPGTNYYQLDKCVSSNGSNCTKNKTINNLPTGEYIVHCDVPGVTPVQCSGNPFCFYETAFPTISLDKKITCSPAWRSCSPTASSPAADDNALLTVSSPSSCTVDLVPASVDVAIGKTATLTATVVPNPLGAEITSVSFVTSDVDKVSLPQDKSSYKDNNAAYTAEVTGKAVGEADITATATMKDNSTCIDSTPTRVNVTNPGPWWQVKDADVFSVGDINSAVPGSGLFGLNGAGGYPGVVAYGGATNLTSTNVSEKNWLVGTSLPALSAKTYDYDYFKKLVPQDVWDKAKGTADTIQGQYFKTESTDGILEGGYKVFKHTGDVTIESKQDIKKDKVIFFVENGNLTIDKNFELGDGEGFFLVVVEGDIIINPEANPKTDLLEGIYFANGSFKTGLIDYQLVVRGSVAANGGLVLERNLLDNSTTPAELFEYAPDQILLFPQPLSGYSMRWKEVAP